jgi:hypothetical protein
MWGWVWDEILSVMYHDFLGFLTGRYWWVACGTLSIILGFGFSTLLQFAGQWSDRGFWHRKRPKPRKTIRYGMCDCNVPECAHVQRQKRFYT